MSFTWITLILAGVLFFGMLLCFEGGRRLGRARIARDPDDLPKGSGPVEAAVLGLLGLLLAFTFSGAASRFEDRRHLVAEEANAIGTAYLRIDLVPTEAQPELRQLFRRYLDMRVDAYKHAADKTPKYSEGAELQGQIWAKAVAACQRPDASYAAMLLLPALNEMIDITTTRIVATQNHPPEIIFVLLAGLNLVSSTLVGYVMCDTKVRNWFYMLLIAFTMSITMYVIIDMEYPRLGLIRVDAADKFLIDLRNDIR